MIYLPGPAHGFEHAGLVNSDDHEIFWAFDGTPRAATWQPVPVKRYREGKHWRPADFPFYFGQGLFMRQSAVDTLRDLLEENGEILPLATDDGVDLFVLNVTHVLDALDEDNSMLERFDDGRISFIEAAAFHENLVRDVDIFKLPGRAANAYVGQRFVDRARAAKLTGLDFEFAWSPERGAIRRRLR